MRKPHRFGFGSSLLPDLLPTVPGKGARPQRHHPSVCAFLLSLNSFVALAPTRCTTTWPVSSCSSPRRRTSCWPSASKSELELLRCIVGNKQLSVAGAGGCCRIVPASLSAAVVPHQLGRSSSALWSHQFVPFNVVHCNQPLFADTPTTGPASAPSCCPPRPSSSCSTARRTGWRATRPTTVSR